MSDVYTDFAKLFMERNNPHIITVGVATVLSPLPNLTLQFGDSIMLERDDLVLSATIVQQILNIGDQVILIPTTDKQIFYAIDKVGG